MKIIFERWDHRTVAQYWWKFFFALVWAQPFHKSNWLHLHRFPLLSDFHDCFWKLGRNSCLHIDMLLYFRICCISVINTEVKPPVAKLRENIKKNFISIILCGFIEVNCFKGLVFHFWLSLNIFLWILVQWSLQCNVWVFSHCLHSGLSSLLVFYVRPSSFLVPLFSVV